MATDDDIRCSNACTRAGISVILLSAIAFSMFTPLDRTRNLQNLWTYTLQRLNLKDQLDNLEKDAAWRALMTTDLADQARNEWNLAKLLDYTVEIELKPRYPAPKTEPSKQESEKVLAAPGVPAAPTNLRIVTTRRIEPLHRVAQALEELGSGDRLTRARHHSTSAGGAIYEWARLRDNLVREGKARNHPGFVIVELDVESESGSTSFISRLLSARDPRFIPTRTRDEMVKNLTLPQVIELANYERPAVSQADALRREEASVTLPAVGVAVGIVQGSTIIEFGMLLSLAYFWLYYREARLSQAFPSSATFFGGLARTRLTRWIFLWSPLIPATAATILAEKSFWYSGDNAVIATLVVAMAVVIRVDGRLPVNP